MGELPHFYCGTPGHARHSKKCLKVGLPFLQLCVKFQVHTLSQKVFRDNCLRSVDIPFFGGRLLWVKHWKHVLSYNFTPVGWIFTKLGINILLDDTYALFNSKFEIRFFSADFQTFQGSWPEGGGQLPNFNWPGWPYSWIKKYDFFVK